MQDLVIDKPYEFVPPVDSRIWTKLIKLYLHRYLRKAYQVHSVECRYDERLQESLDAGHGILLTPNHTRMCDPLVLGELTMIRKVDFFVMASWHAFMQSKFTTFMMRRMGAFSVYREGTDRQALSLAIETMVNAKRPLVVFPEGALSRHNDELMPLMDGVAFMARNAAKKRAKLDPAAKVVVHPVAIRYFFEGDLVSAVTPVLDEIESHFAWRPKKNLPIPERIRTIGEAFLALKEVEYLGQARQGELFERIDYLIEHVLAPLEEEWKTKDNVTSIVARAKNIRSVILPDMIDGNLSEEEKERRWQQIAALYYVQQLSHYPPDYISGDENIPEHILETVERLEEDLTDEARIHGPMRAVVEVGEAIEVEKKRPPKNAPDPLMTEIETQLKTMLAGLAKESKKVKCSD